MKLLAPTGMTGGVDVGGRHLVVGADGTCEVPDDFDPTLLRGVGFTVVPAEIEAEPNPPQDQAPIEN